MDILGRSLGASQAKIVRGKLECLSARMRLVVFRGVGERERERPTFGCVSRPPEDPRDAGVLAIPGGRGMDGALELT